MSPTMLISETVLPEPDSPTMPTISCGATRKETRSTARTNPCSVRKETERSRTSSKGVSAVTAHPWIEDDIGHVDQRVRRHHEEGGVHHIGHDDRQIETLQRV